MRPVAESLLSSMGLLYRHDPLNWHLLPERFSGSERPHFSGDPHHASERGAVH